MAARDRYQLVDRFRIDHGRVFLSGSQALARLPYQQLREDRQRGWKTAAYVSGYPGSPLANFDGDVAAAAKLASADGLTMIAQPAMNEELAAAAVMGTQLAATRESRRYDGVLGIWYGKAPGLDRAGDAIRHGVFAGSSSRGGAVLVVGDDPTAKSSTLPSSSIATLAALRIPVFTPGDVQEAIDLGRHAIAMSRSCGLWTAIEIVESVADGSGTVNVEPGADPVLPSLEIDGRPFAPTPNGMLVTPFTVDIERELFETRLTLARRYAAANGLNSITVRGPADWIGIAAAGHTFHEVRAALRLLGMSTDDELRGNGIRLLRIGLPTPFDVDTAVQFADGLDEIVVVEDKSPHLEVHLRNALYDLTRRPRVVGKQNPDGQPLFRETGALTADAIVPALAARLGQRIAPERFATSGTRFPVSRATSGTGFPLSRQTTGTRHRVALDVKRTPHFCSGCPHNTSTRVPDGTLVGAGIGCHTMTLFMDPERVGEVLCVGAMGTEGAPWIGMAPFVTDEYIVQNLGDGTLFHSGILAIRAAAASGVNITYKILYNGAVAMTGGQDAFGGMTVEALIKTLHAEGVRQIIITTEDRARYRKMEIPAGVKVLDRHRLIEAQEELAKVPGCTVLIHDQRCAAELRRDRKRGKIATPGFRVIINERVCEGCGDCAHKSNCLSVQPVETPFGRKTKIDQNSCNFDLSCMDGDCPAFATVTVDDAREAAAIIEPPSVPDPPRADIDVDGLTIRMSGIGGTGVVTVSQVLGTAAMLDGYTVRGLDQTGLSQKAGPVVSDLRLSRTDDTDTNRATRASVDVLLAFDELVAGSDAFIDAASPERTVLVANTAVTPTGSMVVRPQTAYPAADIHARLGASTRQQVLVDATAVVVGLLGEATPANVFLLGIAVQAGHLPLQPASIERAITLNGVAVERNIAAFRWGRAWVVDPAATARRAGADTVQHETLAQLIERLRADLVDYQNGAYAARFATVVERVAERGIDELTAAVARNLHKLMVYKDEYEIARLLLLPESRSFAEQIGGLHTKVTWRLHPPMLRALGMRNKLQLGRTSTPALHVLRTAKRVRGTALDPFGKTKLRRLERSMVGEYIAAVDTLLAGLGDEPDAARVERAVSIANLPDQVRGYEHLKMQRAATYRQELAVALADYSAGRPTASSE